MKLMNNFFMSVTRIRASPRHGGAGGFSIFQSRKPLREYPVNGGGVPRNY